MIYEHRHTVDAWQWNGTAKHARMIVEAASPQLVDPFQIVAVHSVLAEFWVAGVRAHIGDFIVKQCGMFTTMHPERFNDVYRPTADASQASA